MNTLKEACTIKFLSSKEVLNLSTKETLKLLDVVFNNGIRMFRDYWEVNKLFLDDNFENIK
jgi:hypothetical protein